MALPKGITIQHIGCSIILCIGIILHIVGLATPSWSVATVETKTVNVDLTVGLWKICQIGVCREIPSEYLIDSFQAARAFGILSTLAGLGSLCLASVYFVMNLMDKPDIPMVKIAIMALSIFSLLFMIIATSCYGGDVHQTVNFNFNNVKITTNIGYSLILYAIGGIIICIGGVLFFVVRGREM